MEPLTDNDLRLIEEQIAYSRSHGYNKSKFLPVVERLVDSLREARTLLSEERHKVKRLEEEISRLKITALKRRE